MKAVCTGIGIILILATLIGWRTNAPACEINIQQLEDMTVIERSCRDS